MLLKIGDDIIVDPMAVAAVYAATEEQGFIVLHSGYAIEVEFMPSFGVEDLAAVIGAAQYAEPPAERA